MKVNLTILSVCFTLLTSCASLQIKDPTEHLEEKILACWQARTDKAWGKVYDFYCEDYKSKISKVDFIRSANVNIRSFHIDGIVFSEDKREASVSISYDALMLGYKFSGIKIKEDWSYEKNDWCLKSKRKTFKEIFEK
jgi:hypothetical protein